MKTIFEIAASKDRDYVTPEDVGDSLASGCDPNQVRIDVLKVIGRQSKFCVEDASLCAFIAYSATV